MKKGLVTGRTKLGADVIVDLDDRESIDEGITRVEKELFDLKDEIDALYVAFNSTGKHADHDRFLRCQKDVRFKGRVHQQLLVARGALNRKESAAQYTRATMDTRFVEIARRRLTAELFAEILKEAKGEA